MDEQSRTFTAPVAGRYHVGTGQEPHLTKDCTEACRTWDGRFVAEPGQIVQVEMSVVPGPADEPKPPTIAEQVDAASGPLKRLGAVTAQLDLATIPADAACCCLCSIYEPHICDGWRADGCVRTIPARKLFGYQPPPVEVPTCRSCHGAKPRQA